MLTQFGMSYSSPPDICFDAPVPNQVIPKTQTDSKSGGGLEKPESEPLRISEGSSERMRQVNPKNIIVEAEENEVCELGIRVHHGPGFIQRLTIPQNYS